MLRQIGEYVNGSAAAGGFDRPGANVSRLALALDERGWKQMTRATKRWLAQVGRIQDQADERNREDRAGDGLFEVGLVLLLFEALPISDQARGGAAGDGPARPAARGRSPSAGTPVS
jgi:hypothetical protein